VVKEITDTTGFFFKLIRKAAVVIMTAEGKGDENEKSHLDNELDNSTTVDLVGADDSKAHLIINSNGGAGVEDHMHVKIVDGTAASPDEVAFNGLGKDEVMKYAEEPFWKRLRCILFILFWIGWFAMLITAILIIALAPRCPPKPNLKWYQTESVYQVIPETFKDTNDDGIGDFQGIKDEFDDYIFDELGIKVVWLSNIYKTDGLNYPKELGIIDHKAIRDDFLADPAKLKKWIKDLRKEGKKVILDLIPNQTSKKHEWFQKSQAGDSMYKDYYIWKKAGDGNGTGTDGPPNNWKAMDGSSGWTYDDQRKAWYFHQYNPDYPDLNLSNEKVVEEIKDIMEFWYDKGVGGFHIKDVEYLVEDPDLADDDASNSKTRGTPGTFELLDKLREVADDYDKPGREAFIFATVSSQLTLNETRDNYWGPEDAERLHIVIKTLDEFTGDSNAKAVFEMVSDRLTHDRDFWLGLSLGNQDSKRLASRVAMKKLHVAHALALLLPGTAFNYYGDEFGQKDGNNDNHRTVMQWNGGENAGFTSEGVALKNVSLGTDYIDDNVKAGFAHFTETTPLKGFEKLVALRKEPSFQWGKTKLCAPNEDLFMFSRKAKRRPFYTTLMNLGAKTLTVSLEDQTCLESKEDAVVKFHSRDEDEEGLTINVHDNALSLEPGDVVVVEYKEDEP